MIVTRRLCRMPAGPVMGPDPAAADIELVRAVRGRLTAAGWLTDIAGALVTFAAVGFFIPIFASAHDTARLALINGPVLLVGLLVSGLAIAGACNRHLRRTLQWVIAGRDPGPAEHHRTLGLAGYAVKAQALGWVAGGLVFVALNGFVYSWSFAAVAGVTIWAGGETTCALLYLISERILRPVTARALAAGPSAETVAPGVRARLGMAWALGTGVPLLAVLGVAVVGITEHQVDGRYVAAAIIFLAAVAMIAGPLATTLAAKAIAHPITALRRSMERVERGDLNARVSVDDGSEVGQLQAGFNRMAEGLGERERIHDLFGRQVGHEVARAALRDGVRLGGEEREVGALFVDLVGSTSMALALPPTEVVRVLNRFFRVVIDVVEAQPGLVNKFEGDAALCVFGAPVAGDDVAGDALRCARELAARLLAEVPEVDFGIGVSAGLAVAGNVGAEHRFEYTVIGDPVNEAARLAELAKQRSDRVLASDAALRRAAPTERVAWELGDPALLRGRGTPTGVAHPRG
jgi:adenylate cyclase